MKVTRFSWLVLAVGLIVGIFFYFDAITEKYTYLPYFTVISCIDLSNYIGRKDPGAEFKYDRRIYSETGFVTDVKKFPVDWTTALTWYKSYCNGKTVDEVIISKDPGKKEPMPSEDIIKYEFIISGFTLGAFVLTILLSGIKLQVGYNEKE